MSAKPKDTHILENFIDSVLKYK